MCSACSLIVLYICLKFHENTERTQVYSRIGYFQYLLCSKGHNSRSWLTRVPVFCVLHVVLWCFSFVTNFIISRTVFNYTVDISTW